MKVFKNADVKEYDIRERCSVAELLNDESLTDISVARCRVLPGVTTELHALSGAHEVYLILSGSGEVIDGSGGSSEAVVTDDVVVILPDAPQSIRNIGDDDLIFLAICTPRFRHDRYVVLGD